jgi:hypothetical protein
MRTENTHITSDISNKDSLLYSDHRDRQTYIVEYV